MCEGCSKEAVAVADEDIRFRCPHTVFIGSGAYGVALTEDHILVDGTICYGSYNFSEKLIEIDARIPEEMKKETLIHEVLHGVSDFMSAELSETQVERLGLGILMFLRTNPEAVDYLLEV